MYLIAPAATSANWCHDEAIYYYHAKTLGESCDGLSATDHRLVRGMLRMKRLFMDSAGCMAMADAKDPLHLASVRKIREKL